MRRKKKSCALELKKEGISKNTLKPTLGKGEVGELFGFCEQRGVSRRTKMNWSRMRWGKEH